MATARAKFVFQAVDQTRGAVQSVRRNVKGVERSFAAVQKSAQRTSQQIRKSFRQAEVSLGRLGDRAKRVGRDLTLRLTAPVAAMGVGILKVAGDFEAAMNRVQVKTGATGESFDRLREQAKRLGATTQFSARQAAEGQEILATAGFKAEQILGALPGTLDLAAAGSLELGEAARYVSAGVNQFALEATEAGRVADVLAKGALLSDQAVGDLGEALSKSASTAKSFGVGLEETGAALSVLAQQGRRAEEGGTAFRNFLAEVQSPTNAARKRVQDLGLSLNNVDGSLKSVSEILATFNAAGINAANSAQFFQKRVGDTYRILDQGQPSLRAWTEELNNAAGTAANVAAANLKGFRGELTKLRSALEGLAIAIADSGLLAWATSLAERLGGLASRLTETNPAVLRMATLIGLVAAAIGPAILAVGAMAASFGALAGLPATLAALGASVSGVAVIFSGPALLATAALAAGFVALVSAWRDGSTWLRTVAGLFSTIASDLTATLEPVVRVMAGLFRDVILPALKAVGEALLTGLAVAFRVLATVIRVTVGPMLEALADWLGSVLPKVIDVAKDAWDGLVRFIRIAASKLLEVLAELLGFLGKLPGAIGEGFRDGAAKLGEFASAIGDLEKPVAEAVLAVSSFGATAEATGDTIGDLSPWERLLEKLRAITGAANEATDAQKGAADAAAAGPEEAAPPPAPDITIPTKALLDLARVGKSVKEGLETGLATAITGLAHPIQAITDLFRNLWTSVINEIARQIAVKITAKLLGLFAGGPLGFLAGAVADLAGKTANAELATGPGPTLAKGSTPAPTGAGAATVVLYQSFLPGSIEDRVRAGRSVRRVNKQAARVILGTATG